MEKKNRIKSSVGLFIAAALTLSQVATAATTPAAGKYDIDPAHSKIGFEVSHVVISTVEGRFNQFSGNIVIADKPAASQVETQIDAASIDTGMAKRDEHLKSPDFLDVKKFPTVTFKSKKVSVDGSALKILGDLTLHGITKEITLDGKFLGAIKDAQVGEKIAFQASTKISRKDYGLTWNKLIEAGPMVGDEVTISLKIEANRAAEVKK